MATKLKGKVLVGVILMILWELSQVAIGVAFGIFIALRMLGWI